MFPFMFKPHQSPFNMTDGIRHELDQEMPMLEAAEALTALMRGGAVSQSPEDQAVAACRENKYKTAANSLISGVTDNVASKLRQNMEEAEKEARRLRRILANRESAWQTVRRRQAMYQELMRKAVDLSEENEDLKKEKVLAVVEYNSLKGRNKFLKLQMANVKKVEPRETKVEAKSSQAEKLTSATNSLPISLYNHPSLVPFLWPYVPSSNVVHLQYPSHSAVTNLSELSLQSRDMSPCDVGITGPGNPLFVLPLPLALPFPIYGAPLAYSDTKERLTETPSAHRCSMSSTSENILVAENNEESPKLNELMKASSCKRNTPAGNSSDLYAERNSEVTLLMPEKLSCIKPEGSVRAATISLGDNSSNPYVVSAKENMLETLPKKVEPVICHHKKSENIFAATKARRRRKEVIMLKNVQNHLIRPHSANS